MAPLVLGIRREDKNLWERRVPLTPANVHDLVRGGFEVVVQPSPIRVFRDAEYAAAGARIGEDLSRCGVVMGVKEMPASLFRPDVVYVFFAHVIKGQRYNMPMLRTLLERKAGLIDYEKIVDGKGRRLVLFGRHAGLAGTIDSLWALGDRLRWEGFDTPFVGISPAHRYANLDEAKQSLGEVGRKIAAGGLPAALAPLVVGIAGYGNVASGAVEILDALGAREVSVADLPGLFRGVPDRNAVFRVTFKEEDSVEPVAEGAEFDLREFFAHPERYRGRFHRYVPHLSLLLNCIYWDAKYPRLLTKAFARDLFSRPETPRLRVIGDISCDVEGGIELTLKATTPDDPLFVWDPENDRAVDGVEGHGPVIMAVDNLPCEIPAEASAWFGKTLVPFVPEMLRASWTDAFDRIALSREVKDAVIAHRGALTPKFEYIATLW
jgi:alpha-aminoadipic semialdehyde synthase